MALAALLCAAVAADEPVGSPAGTQPALPLATGLAAEVAVSVDPARGDMVSLRVGGREFAAGAQSLFSLTLTDPRTRQSETITSRHARAVAVRTSGPDGGINLTFTFSDDLFAKVAFSPRPAGDGLETSIEVANHTGRVLEEIRYPDLVLKGKPGESARSVKLFMPGGDGYVVTRAGLLRHRWHQRAYPGQASMQFMAYYDDEGGLTVQTRDAQAAPKEFGAYLDRQKDRLSFVVIHRRPLAGNQPFASSPIALLYCGAHWTSAAGQYRAWARTQPWAKPKQGDALPPQWLREGFLTLGGTFRPLGVGRYVVPFEKWPIVVRQWRQATGATAIMLDVRGWERYGQYCSPFYFPMHPSNDRIKSVFDACLPERAHGMAMVAGLKWMIERKAFPGRSYHVLGFDFRDRFDDQARNLCVVGHDGKVLIHEPAANWDGRLAYMCPAHPFTLEHFRKTARQLAEAGFALFEFDQMNGGYCPFCHSPDHDHPLGSGTWQREAIARIMFETRAEGRKIDLRFATSLEDPQEAYLPQLDSYVSRAGHISHWPAPGEGSAVVPAFTFVYHPLARAISFDVQGSVSEDPYQILQMGRYFIRGATPSTNMAWWQLLDRYGEDDLLPIPEKIHPDQLKLLRAIVATHCGPGLPYLSFGEMLAADRTEYCLRTWSYRRWDGKQMIEETITHPDVMASAWEDASGRRAFVFVNLSTEPRRFDADFAVAGRSPTGDTPATVFVDGKPRPTTTVSERKQIEMSALSTLLVEFDRPSHRD